VTVNWYRNISVSS